ncbi:MAG: MBL fold metallo-hydrolase [Streptosporangiales bacterium]|nr:MBL fold metallo-hydrolase [Streptosporangiales bacterium]
MRAMFPESGEGRPPEQGSRLVLLGTAGGPRVHGERSGPAQVITAGGGVYLVDCGYGVLRRLLEAGISPVSVEHLFITHHHSDHNLDLGALILLSWTAGRTRKLNIWGPPPLEEIVGALVKAHDYDITTRTADEERPSLESLLSVHEIRRPGPVMVDDRVRVSCALVHHPPVEPAFAFRFDAGDRSFVISGDTVPSESLVGLAAGADVLVHEVLHEPSVPAILGRFPNPEPLRRHLLASHTTTDEVGVIARRAGVGTLVLSHLAPADSRLVSRDQWLERPTDSFPGPVILGEDLLTI